MRDVRQLLIHLTVDEHMSFKVACRIHGVSMNRVLRDFMMGYVDSVPKERLLSLMTVEAGHGLIAEVDGGADKAEIAKPG